ncbi:MAG: hypothetical protein AB1595_05195 [bacterium]
MGVKELTEAFRKAMVDVLVPELRELRQEMNLRFEEVNKRFEEVNKRFEELYREMDRRFIEVHKEISLVKGEISATNKILERIWDRLDLVERVAKLEDRTELILHDLEIIRTR